MATDTFAVELAQGGVLGLLHQGFESVGMFGFFPDLVRVVVAIAALIASVGVENEHRRSCFKRLAEAQRRM